MRTSSSTAVPRTTRPESVRERGRLRRRAERNSYGAARTGYMSLPPILAPQRSRRASDRTLIAVLQRENGLHKRDSDGNTLPQSLGPAALRDGDRFGSLPETDPG